MENIKIKIVVGVMVFLAILSSIFLATAKKKPVQKVATQTQSQVANKPQPNVASNTKTEASSTNINKNTAPKITPQQALENMKSQWQNCKAGNFDAKKEMFWRVKITEEIPQGGTYAKGFIGGDQTFPVHVIIKSDSQIVDKIKSMLVLDKEAFLRGNCTELAADGSVVLQAY